MKKNSHAFVNQIVAWLLVTISFGGSIGLGTVWMRQQISRTANANRVLVAQINEVQRRIAETNALLEAEQSLEALRRRNTEWNLGLVPVNETQVERITGDPVERMAARANRALFLTDAPAPRIQLVVNR
jgi:hypothetical protein